MIKEIELKKLGRNLAAVLILGQLLSASGLYAQVDFARTQDFGAMQATAMEEDKFIFIDAYTDWCGWCKVMDKNTFSDQGVADYMQSQFVSYKLEMEKDSLGKLLSMKYAITGFPSYLIINPDGTLHTILVGYMEIDAWIQTLEEVMSAATPSRPSISTNLVLDWPDFYKDAFGQNGKRKSPEKEEVIAYLKQNKPDSEVPFIISKRYSFWLPDNSSAEILDSRAQLSDFFAADLVDDLIKSILQGRISKQISIDDEAALEKSIVEYELYFPGEDDIRPRVYQAFYLKNKKYTELSNLVEADYADYTPASMNALCWDLYTGCEDQEVLKKAAGWMQDVVSKEPVYAYLDTYAALLYKTGAYGEAEKWATKAIEIGKAENEKVDDTQKLLEKIKAARG